MTRTYDPQGRGLTVTRTWTVRGRLSAPDQATLQVLKARLELAYSVPFQNAYLLFDDGLTVHDGLVDRGSIHGVRVLRGPSYPNGRGAELCTYLSYEIVLSADYVVSRLFGGSDPKQLSAFSETITITGGGPRYAVVDVVDGPPVRQLLNTQTKVRIVQAGSATGHTQAPSPPPPLYPDFENAAERNVSQKSPEQQGRSDSTGFQCSWQYVMEASAADLTGGSPSGWPGD